MQPTVVPSDGGQLHNVLGVPHRIKVGGKETDGAMLLVEVVVEPGRGTPPHIHTNEDELFQVIKGSVVFRIGDGTITATPGMTVFAPRGGVHGFQAVGDAPAIMHVSIFPAGLEVMFAELAELPPGPPNVAAIGSICSRYGVNLLPPPEKA